MHFPKVSVNTGSAAPEESVYPNSVIQSLSAADSFSNDFKS